MYTTQGAIKKLSTTVFTRLHQWQLGYIFFFFLNISVHNNVVQQYSIVHNYYTADCISKQMDQIGERKDYFSFHCGDNDCVLLGEKKTRHLHYSTQITDF